MTASTNKSVVRCRSNSETVEWPAGTEMFVLATIPRKRSIDLRVIGNNFSGGYLVGWISSDRVEGFETVSVPPSHPWYEQLVELSTEDQERLMETGSVEALR